VTSACKEMDALHRLLNGIALLDVLQSFAAVVGFPLPSVACAEVRSTREFPLHQGLSPLTWLFQPGTLKETFWPLQRTVEVQDTCAGLLELQHCDNHG
jgi:hypothetical protein